MSRIVATIGAPRSGKSTLAAKLDPNYWVTVTYDDLRQTLWPPHRRTYWTVREGPNGDAAQRLLHRVKFYSVAAALDSGFNVITPDTYTRQKEADELKEVAEVFGITVEWLVLQVPWEVLEYRNQISNRDLGHQVPDDVLKEFYNRVWALDAWWRSEPNVKIIPWLDDNGELFLDRYSLST